MTAIRILLVDDHEVLRSNIRRVLAADPDLAVISEAASGFEAVRKAEEDQPDIVLLNISIPELNGLQAAPLIKKVAPTAEISFVTQFDNPFFIREAFAAGGRGFLTKSDVGAELLTAIRAVHLKKEFVSRSVGSASLSGRIRQPNAAPDASSD